MKDLLKRHLASCKKRVVGIDPGETTGICCFEGPDLLDARQLKTKDAADGGAQILRYIKEWNPNVLVVEDYRVYAWKTQDHTWASLHTPRLIGILEYIGQTECIPVVKRMAQQAKGFCTDDKLKAWGLYQKGQRHSRDAIRHAVYYLLFDIAKAHQLPKESNHGKAQSEAEEASQEGQGDSEGSG